MNYETLFHIVNEIEFLTPKFNRGTSISYYLENYFDHNTIKQLKKEIKKLPSLSYENLLMYEREFQKSEKALTKDIKKYLDNFQEVEEDIIKYIKKIHREIFAVKSKIQKRIRKRYSSEFDEGGWATKLWTGKTSEERLDEFYSKIDECYVIPELKENEEIEILIKCINDNKKILKKNYTDNDINIDFDYYFGKSTYGKDENFYEYLASIGRDYWIEDSYFRNVDTNSPSSCKITKIEECISLIYKWIKEPLIKAKRRAKERERTSKISAFNKKSRTGALTIRGDLLKNVNSKSWKCPYCHKSRALKTAQADHIHPVNKGGLSTIQNMVVVCKPCNQKKRNFTLRNFAKKNNLDFEAICLRLEKLGKDI
tara:strand:- start:116 stop:1222 length:1107 start_codon:yes stop_codon:yes gene_type:complete